ncbi:MAG: PAS domain-containing protein [Bacteroidia bacterium]|nr:PAS domain-containing protein [Bacteroidia bacterium]
MQEKKNQEELEIENKKLKVEIERLRQYVSLPSYERRAILEVYKRFASNSLSPITLSDDNENILYANPAFCKLLDYPMDEMVSKNLRQFTNRVEFSTYQVNTYLRKKGIAGLYESILIKKDESEINVQLSASPVFNDENVLICIMTIYTDLTRFCKNNELPIQKSENL